MPSLSRLAAFAARVSLLVTLAACVAAEPQGWQRADTSAQAVEEDLAECRGKASPAFVMVTPPTGPQSHTFEGSVMRGMYEVRTCMRLKGYTPAKAGR